jgi:hypothetical protein
MIPKNGEHDMEQRFAVLAEEEKPKIYKVPFNRTARIINEFPFQHVEVFETLGAAKLAAWTLAESLEMRLQSQNEELRNTLAQLTEDRVETYYF